MFQDGALSGSPQHPVFCSQTSLPLRHLFAYPFAQTYQNRLLIVFLTVFFLSYQIDLVLNLTDFSLVLYN